MSAYSPEIGLRKAAALIAGAVGCFHVAFSTPAGFFIIGFVACVMQLARLPTARQAFYAGVVTGFLCYGPQLSFFWTIFGTMALTLWAVLAFWLGVFVALLQAALRRLGAAWLAPFLWMGIEYFRGEAYYLRFTWLSAGYAFAGSTGGQLLHSLGLYGTGLAIAMAGAVFLARRAIVPALGVIVVVAALLGRPPPEKPERTLRVAGVQMEFPLEAEVLARLDALTATHPEAELLVLSEYTLKGPVPEKLKEWCRAHRKHLIVGGADPAKGGDYYNTAFVVSPEGAVVFKQAKSMPIQFFRDGLPAPSQQVWDSPWGRLGLCICYDLSYRRVTDALIRQGAQALIVPTMDEVGWGACEHELHRRIAPTRAAEYGVPIFRLASSGISQAVDAGGRERASAPFPGRGEMISAELAIGRAGRRPLDWWLGPVAAGLTGLVLVWLAAASWRTRRGSLGA